MSRTAQPSASAQLVFRALGDPTRRAILDLLAASDHSVHELTRSFAISQPAVSQHLRELREARLVTATKIHREQRYRLTPEPIKLVLEWTDRYRRFFDVAGHLWEFVPLAPQTQPHVSAGRKKEKTTRRKTKRRQ
jgi:DNA-binding transcriptional ArsR family regulator